MPRCTVSRRPRTLYTVLYCTMALFASPFWSRFHTYSVQRTRFAVSPHSIQKRQPYPTVDTVYYESPEKHPRKFQYSLWGNVCLFDLSASECRRHPIRYNITRNPPQWSTVLCYRLDITFQWPVSHDSVRWATEHYETAAIVLDWLNPLPR